MHFKNSLRICLITVSALVVCGLDGNFFNCKREGIRCDSGTCADNGLSCSCQSGSKPVKFLCFKTNIQASPCSAGTQCQNGGECVQNNTQGGSTEEFCVCDQMWTGALCETRRFETKCTPDSGMTVTILPFGNSFTGLMYAQNFQNDAKCKLKQTTTNSGIYTNTFNFTACGMNSFNHTNGSLEYFLPVIVQYSAQAINNFDQRLIASCIFRADSVLQGGLPSVNASFDQLDQGSQSVQADMSGSLEFSILDAKGGAFNASSPPVLVGTPLLLQILLKKNTVFQHLLVQNCVASSRENTTFPEYDFIPVVKDTCPVNNAIVSGNHTAVSSEAAKGVRIPVTAVLFVNGSDGGRRNQLHFVCRVLLCSNATLSKCAPQNATFCANNHNGAFPLALGRRRRATAADDSSRTVGGALTVVSSAEEPVHTETTIPEANQCLKVPVLQAVIVVLAVVVFLLLLALCVQCALLRRLHRRDRQQKASGYDDSSTSSGSALRMTLYADPLFAPAKGRIVY